MIYPTREQTWLLRACLSSGRDAVGAWELWRRHVKFEEIDGDSYRLLPLVHQNLRREKVTDELLGRITGIYRHTWSRNQLLFHAASGVMREMAAANIPVLALKGAVLASAYYEDLGRRPMGDFDFLVPLAKVSRAFEVMAQSGWHYADKLPVTQVAQYLHAGKWTNGRGQQIDLHWYSRPEDRQPGVDDELWTRSRPTMIGGHPFPAMDPTDLLWHVCAHGVDSNANSPLRWIADACLVLQKNPVIEWERLADSMQRRGQTIPVGQALAYLRSEFSAPVPPEVLATLAAVRVSRVERWAHQVKLTPTGWTGALPVYCANYLLQTRGQTGRRRLAGFTGYLQSVWSLPSVWHLPASFFKRVQKRFRRRAR